MEVLKTAKVFLHCSEVSQGMEVLKTAKVFLHCSVVSQGMEVLKTAKVFLNCSVVSQGSEVSQGSVVSQGSLHCSVVCGFTRHSRPQQSDEHQNGQWQGSRAGVGVALPLKMLGESYLW